VGNQQKVIRRGFIVTLASSDRTLVLIFLMFSTDTSVTLADSSFVSDISSSVSNVSFDDNHPLLCGTTIVFCHVNIHSLMPAFDKFKEFMLNFQRPVVMVVTETWLSPLVTPSEISIEGYATYHLNHDSRGDGVLLYVAHCYSSWRREDLEHSAVEAVWVEL